jgi:signal transduction histidine kinase
LGTTPTGVELRISDHGMGIAPEVLPKIFDPLFTTKPFGEGTGLGLTIVHDIMAGEFGGRIEVKTRLGEGTTFTVIFPEPVRDT